MPDAAKLVAAICLAITGYILSRQIMPLMPESTDFGYFVQVNTVLGLVVGWIVMGKRAGRGVTSAINNGLTGVAMLILWGIFIQACYEMFRLAMKNRYDGPFESIVAIFEIGAGFGLIMLTIEIGMTVVAAAVLSGLSTEVAWRKWR